MPTTRQRFTFASSAAVSDTGPPIWGELVQARWEQTGVADTGGDLTIYAQQREADTGNGVLVVDDNDVLGADFVRQWRSPTHDTAGVAIDTGGDFPEPVVLAGDRLRVKITPAGGTVSGNLYIWAKD